MNQDLPNAAIILAAGHGTRMKSALPKVLHPIGGLSMLGHVISGAKSLDPQRLAVVIGDHAPEVGDTATLLEPNARIFVQAPPRGTADAVTHAMPGLEGFEGIVFVLYADTPLIRPETLSRLADLVADGAAIAVLGFEAAEPGAYGRLVVNDDGDLDRIVEAKDALPDELAITLCNSGVMAIASESLARHLPEIRNDNAKGEFYLTDIVGLARAAGARCAVLTCPEDEVLGVNSRIELSIAEARFQERQRKGFMANGVTLTDPKTTYFSYDTVVEPDVVIEPGCFFGTGVSIARGATILAHCHLVGASVGQGAVVGPFARLRPGAVLGARAKAGNFVEIKKADIGDGAKVNHLTYIGDATVGAEANIGAGTITCNFDGFRKFRTEIGPGAFIGSNSSLVAPVRIGEGAYVGSGSVITKDVERDALSVARGRQISKAGWALSFRTRQEG